MSLRDPFGWSSDDDFGSSLSEEEDRPSAPKKKTKRAPNPHTDQGNPQSVSEGNCKGTQMNGGLCGNTEIGDDMKKSFPWVLLPIFSKVALNNAGRKEQCVQKR
jgi:hypothetical protein